MNIKKSWLKRVTGPLRVLIITFSIHLTVPWGVNGLQKFNQKKTQLKITQKQNLCFIFSLVSLPDTKFVLPDPKLALPDPKLVLPDQEFSYTGSGV